MSSEDHPSKYPSAFHSTASGSDAGDPETLPVAESAEQQVASLTARLDAVEAENRELQDRFLRSAAEFENSKKRMRRDQAEASRYAAEPLVRDLLPIVDNLERAVTHAGDGNAASLAEGVTLVLKSLHDVLKQHGVKFVEAQAGESFDPNLHEAVDRREGDGAPNLVVDAWQRGYQLHDRLLRPALVVVSAARSR
jgi:molecular chaperone GrpE